MIYQSGDVTLGGEPEELALFLALISRINAHPEEWDMYRSFLNTMIHKFGEEDDDD